MVDGFNEQEDRLVRLGISFADMTGADFDSSSIPREESSDAPVASVDIVGRESLTKSAEPIVPSAAVDPVATVDSSFLPPDKDLVDSDAGPEASGLEFEGPTEFSLNSESPVDMPLPEDEEKVYDLEDFGASPAAEQETEDPEQVFDLSSFGAIPMAGDEDQDPDQVFELSDFGAARSR